MAKFSHTIAFVANMWNIIFATGMFTLPFSLWQTGLILGSFILILIAGISYYTCGFLVEAIAIQNNLQREENEGLLNLEKPSSIIESTDIRSSLEVEQQDRNFIYKRYEIITLAGQVASMPTYIFIAFIMVSYLYICLVSNSVILGNALLFILGRMIYGNDEGLHPNYYQLFVILYFVSVIIISQRNIEQLKKLTSVIMFVRLFVIALFFGSMFYVIAEHGATDLSTVPLARFENVTLMFGNTLLFFMVQHSIPGMVEGFRPQSRLIPLLGLSYGLGLIVFLFYGVVSFMAFGKYTNCDFNEFPSAIVNYFNLNFLTFNVIGYVLNLYPLFNIITGSIQLITLRNNFIAAIGGCYKEIEDRFERNRLETGWKPYMINFTITAGLCFPPILLALLMRDVQQIFKYFNSFLGFFLLIAIPMYLMWKLREKLRESNLLQGKINKSSLRANMWVYLASLLSVALLIVIFFGVLNKDTRTCVAEEEEPVFERLLMI